MTSQGRILEISKVELHPESQGISIGEFDLTSRNELLKPLLGQSSHDFERKLKDVINLVEKLANQREIAEI